MMCRLLEEGTLRDKKTAAQWLYRLLGSLVYRLRIELSRYATGTDSQTLSCVAERDGNQGDQSAYTQFQDAVCIG